RRPLEMCMNERPMRVASLIAWESSIEERNSIGKPRWPELPVASITPGAKPGLSCRPSGSGTSTTNPVKRYVPPLELVSTPTVGRIRDQYQGGRTWSSIPRPWGTSLRNPYCPVAIEIEAGSARADTGPRGPRPAGRAEARRWPALPGPPIALQGLVLAVAARMRRPTAAPLRIAARRLSSPAHRGAPMRHLEDLSEGQGFELGEET